VELPRPDSVNFYEMTRTEQNAYYAKHVRGLITWLLQQSDFPDKFRRAVETIDDYTYYICEEIGVRKVDEDNFICEDPECGCEGCDGDCDCVDKVELDDDLDFEAEDE